MPSLSIRRRISLSGDCADGCGVCEGVLPSRVNQLPSAEPSELSGTPQTDEGSGDRDIGLPLKIPSSGPGSVRGTGWFASRALEKIELTLRFCGLPKAAWSKRSPKSGSPLRISLPARADDSAPEPDAESTAASFLYSCSARKTGHPGLSVLSAGLGPRFPKRLSTETGLSGAGIELAGTGGGANAPRGNGIGVAVLIGFVSGFSKPGT